MPGAELPRLVAAFDPYQGLYTAVLEQLQIDATYDQYADRQAKEVADLRRQETQRIPQDFDYAQISGLSTEMKQKLSRARPASILGASRVEGVTPAALLLVLASLRRPQAGRRAG